MNQLQKTISIHWLAFILIIIGAFLRTYRLQTNAILFGDSARDIQAAFLAVDQNKVPLLGIPSSLPRFKQGPVSIYFIMFLYLLFGSKQLIVYSIGYAFIGILALILLYDFCLTYFNKNVANIALALMALSPLAIAHSRMVYHITPIPLFLIIFLWFLVKLWNKDNLSLLWSVLFGWLLFQFELSLFPLLLLIPYVLYRSHYKKTEIGWWQIVVATLLGLLPQILYDISHGFSQLGGFGLWLAYRSVAFFVPSKHTLSISKFGVTLNQYWVYMTRVWSANSLISTILGTIGFAIGLYKIKELIVRKKLNRAGEIIFVGCVLITLGYVIPGTPGEAYFPPYLVLIPILTAMGINGLRKNMQKIVFGGIFVLMTVNAIEIFKHNFFVSNTQRFSYGPSIEEQEQIVLFANNITQGNFKFVTTHPDGKFETHFDHLKLVAQKNGFSENNASDQLIYVEEKGSRPTLLLPIFPKIQKKPFASRDVYVVLN